MQGPHVWLSCCYKISCLGTSAEFSGNDTSLWKQLGCSLLKPGAMERLKSHGMSWLLKLLSYCLECLRYLCRPLVTARGIPGYTVPGQQLKRTSANCNKTHTTRIKVPYLQKPTEVTSSQGIDPPPGCHTSPFAPATNSLQSQDHPRPILCHPKTRQPSPELATHSTKNMGNKNWPIQKRPWWFDFRHFLIDISCYTKQAFIIPAGTAHPLTAGSWVQPQDQQQVSFHRPKSITGRSVRPVVWFFLL